MLKIVGGVIAGYVVMFIIVFVLFSAAYLSMGADGAFKAGSYEVTPLWLIVILGLLMAIPVLTASDSAAPKVRDASVGNLEAMQNAKQPAWVALLNPVVGAFGVFFGARLKKSK